MEWSSTRRTNQKLSFIEVCQRLDDMVSNKRPRYRVLYHSKQVDKNNGWEICELKPKIVHGPIFQNRKVKNDHD
jgi:hypothetical protein